MIAPTRFEDTLTTSFIHIKRSKIWDKERQKDPPVKVGTLNRSWSLRRAGCHFLSHPDSTDS